MCQARAAAQQVQVDYEELPAIVGIQEAIKADSFIEVGTRTCSAALQRVCSAASPSNMLWWRGLL